MGEDDEFELVSHEELEELRKEVENIKKNPLGDTTSSMNLLDSMNDLTRAIKNLVSIFENTEKELLNEYSKNKADYKIDRLLEQNKEIALGIVKVADMIREKTEAQSMAKPVQRNAFPPPPESKSSFQPMDFQEPIMASRQQPAPKFIEPNYPRPGLPLQGPSPAPMPQPPQYGPSQRPVPSQDDFGLDLPLPPPDFDLPEEKPKKKMGLFRRK
jgi:hypothetical protein